MTTSHHSFSHPARSRAVSEKEMARRHAQRLLSLADVCERTGRSRWWVRAAVLEGRFPKPVSTGSRSPRWVEHEIDDWIGSLIAKRDAQLGAA